MYIFVQWFELFEPVFVIILKLYLVKSIKLHKCNKNVHIRFQFAKILILF